MKEYSLIPKHKSDVQFNGDIIYNKSWIIPYIRNVRNEFDQRYDEIKKQYDKLIDEVYWNNIIYNIELRFQPVIGNYYYLYKDDEKYIINFAKRNKNSRWSNNTLSYAKELIKQGKMSSAGLEALLPKAFISKGYLLIGLLGSLFYFFIRLVDF